MPDRNDRAAPHADRYGHPEGANLMTLMQGSHEHGVAAPHCDRHGHVDGIDPTKKVAGEAVVVHQG
ncbi:MAG TPA: hypothetical protein VGH55_00945 [Chthoniobacterales bacterium]|jgi:hypothetical protein